MADWLNENAYVGHVEDCCLIPPKWICSRSSTKAMRIMERIIGVVQGATTSRPMYGDVLPFPFTHTVLQLLPVAELLGVAHFLIWHCSFTHLAFRTGHWFLGKFYHIANLKDDLGDGAVCDSKAIHQTVVTVPDFRNHNVFANFMPAVRWFLQFYFFSLILCSTQVRISWYI